MIISPKHSPFHFMFQICKAMNLSYIRDRPWKIVACSAKTSEGISQGINWAVDVWFEKHRLKNRIPSPLKLFRSSPHNPKASPEKHVTFSPDAPPEKNTMASKPTNTLSNPQNPSNVSTKSGYLQAANQKQRSIANTADKPTRTPHTSSRRRLNLDAEVDPSADTKKD
eukprot:TRINITY_DN12593_c0_g1_i1.p1 TRINITY_DN12593_c0_g1~~TRINITY_DN12593_c0_g1_i1.p1  ORF type:complete len:168 (+),score=26.18 TRINITY_DN12593_c0_g1_i1:72-575(+)